MIRFTTVSGHVMDLEHPQPSDITFDDVSHGLSHCCRFAGHVPEFYSVAQHSLLVASLVDPELRLPALLHDASEAYLGDLTRNLKHHPLLSGYLLIEARLQATIERRLLGRRTGPAEAEAIKHADNLAAIVERYTVKLGRTTWRGEADVQEALADGYLKNDVVPLLRLLPRVPTYYRPASIEFVRNELFCAYGGTVFHVTPE